MKNILKRIIVGIIIGLVLMCARKYLFVSASALERNNLNIDSWNYTSRFGSSYTLYAPINPDTPIKSTDVNIDGGGHFNFSYHPTNNINVSKNNYIYFTTQVNLWNPVDDNINNTISVADYSILTIGEHQFYCSNTLIMYDNETHYYYQPTKEASSGTAVYSPYYFMARPKNQEFKLAFTYKCFIDKDITINNTNSSFKVESPYLSIHNYQWQFWYEYTSEILIINNIESTIIDSQQATTNAVEDVNNSINDSTTDDPGSDIDNMKDKVATNGTISQLLTLPIQLYQNILNSVSGSCSSFNLGNLFGTNLLLPCINLQQLLGSTLYGIIDILCSGLFILSFRKKMVDIFNHMTSLNDRGNELE